MTTNSTAAENRLGRLGIHRPDVPTPFGAYVPDAARLAQGVDRVGRRQPPGLSRTVQDGDVHHT